MSFHSDEVWSETAIEPAAADTALEPPAISAGLANVLVLLLPVMVLFWIIFGVGVYTVITWLV